MQTEAEGAGDWSRAVPLLMELRDVLKTCAAGGSAADATVFNPLIGECEERLTNARRRLVQPPSAAAPRVETNKRDRRASETAPPARDASARTPAVTAKSWAPPAAARPAAAPPAPAPAPPPAAGPCKVAKHDWGASARARVVPHVEDQDDDDGDDVRIVCEGKPSAAATTTGSTRSGPGSARGPAWRRSSDGAARESAPKETIARGVASFVSAGERLDAENAKRGLPPTRRGGAGAGGGEGGSGGGGGGGGSVARNGYVPPYVRKAIGGPAAGGGSGQSQKPAGPGGGGDPDEPPFSEQVMRRLSPRGEPISENLLKMDRDIVERVVSEILERPATIEWSHIAGLEHAKAAVQELAVWPLLKPELFRGARAVPRGLLLFGPPGTGKTLIGRAVASQCGATFFSISASSLTSKWIGEGEKMVRALFAVAATCEPAVIFVDEIDSLLSARKSDGEHESSRRMKTEFLVQMDGLGGGEEEGRLLLIGATNRPQELDDGARRRLAKQLYIPLPCAAARRAIITNILGADKSVTHALSDADLDVVCLKTEGYSGSDMKHLVQEAARAPLRELFRSRVEAEGALADAASAAAGPLSPSAMRPIKLADFKRASKQVRPSVTRADIDFHEEWNRKHGAMSGADAREDEEEEDDDW